MGTERWLIDGHHYEVDTSSPLGRGSYGFVFGATTESGDLVAIKKIPDAALVAGLERELDNVRDMVGHSFANVVTVYAAAVEGDNGYVVMELATGTLEQQLPLSEDAALNAVEQIANGLLELHQLGIIHRDLKPANILDTPSGLKITDFGFGRLIGNNTASATFRNAGTPLYMAPEQWTGERSSVQTDLYALGCIAYELLTGQPPFIATNTDDIRDQHLTDAPVALACSDDRSATLVHRLLNKKQSDRPQDAREVLERLKTIQASEQPNAVALGQIAAQHQQRLEVDRQSETAAQQILERRQAIDQQGKDALSDILDDFIAVAKSTLTNVVKLSMLSGVTAAELTLHTKVGKPRFGGTFDEDGHIVYAGSVSFDIGPVHHPDVMNIAYIRSEGRYRWRAYQLSHHAGPVPRPAHLLQFEQGQPPIGITRNDWLTEIEQGRGPYVQAPLEVGYKVHSDLFTAQHITAAIPKINGD